MVLQYEPYGVQLGPEKLDSFWSPAGSFWHSECIIRSSCAAAGTEEWFYEGVNASESSCGVAADASAAADASTCSAAVDFPLRGEAAGPQLLQQKDTMTR